MPRGKHWRKSDSKRRERRERPRTDDCKTADRSVESPSNVGAGRPPNVGAGRPPNVGAKANISQYKQILANNSQSKQANICQSKNANIDFKSLIASHSSNKQTDFDTVFLDCFPDLATNYQSKLNEDLSEREDIAFCYQNAMHQEHEECHENVQKQHHFNSDHLEAGSDSNVCYEAIRLSEQLWNANDLVFGSFHQNDVRFSELSRGYQCTCIALCMLSYAHCHDVNNSLILDKVLCEGDALYQNVISKLKTDGNFVQPLLSLEEIPDEFQVEIGKFTLEKFRIKSGPLVDANDLGLPTLHEVLQSVFLSVSSGLLTIGAICSAVFKKNGLYVFFDSHSHGENGLSSNDGVSSLITFSSLNDLITYMYAFYDSMKLDTSLQFDFLPINVTKSGGKQSCKDDIASHMEAYFNDQRLKQAKKKQSNVRKISNVSSSISIEESKKASEAKTKKLRTEYYKIYKRRMRQNLLFKAKEGESRQFARKDPVFKTKERESKQQARRNPVFRAKETVYQKVSKQSARSNPVFRTKENVYQKESKQCARKDTIFKAKERESKQQARRNPVFRAKETVYQKASKQCARKDTIFKAKERESKQQARTNPVFRAKETVYQKESKQCARKYPDFKTKERESKQQTRRNPVFRAKEILYQKKSKELARENEACVAKEKGYQNASKKKARENPYVLECERMKKQQIRREKRKFNDDSGINIPRKRCKHDTDTLPKSHQKDLKTVEESIKLFHSDIAIGPLYVCSCCHQTWFRKSISMLKKTHIFIRK